MRNRDRRRWIAAALAGTAAAGIGTWMWHGRDQAEAPAGPRAPEDIGPRNPVRLPGESGLLAPLDASRPFNISARAHAVELEPGATTPMLLYEVEQDGRALLNPVLRIATGQVLQATFWNRLDETSIVHWHGLHVDANNDGNPHYAVGPGELYRYRIRIDNRAATCWYHPHPHALTAAQVYRGLASFLLVEDDEEGALQQALDLTLGSTDLPLLLQDRRFEPSGALSRGGDTADRFFGHLGDTMLVNYTRRPVLDAPARLVRLRLLNGASARVLRVAFLHRGEALPFSVIGADGGLLERPLAAREAFLSPGERLDLLLDLARVGRDEVVWLASLGFDPMHTDLPDGSPPIKAPGKHGHARATFQPPLCVTRSAGGPPGASPVPQGEPMSILPIRVRPANAAARSIPAKLSHVPVLDPAGAASRLFTLDHRGLAWQINGIGYDMLATPVRVKRGATEIWEIRNRRPGMPHPMHMHGFHFRLLDRRDSPAAVRALATDERGLAPAEQGWKDTVLVWPGETVRFAIRFAHDHPGEQVYMFHCHNLEHEDQGMMLNVRIVGS